MANQLIQSNGIISEELDGGAVLVNPATGGSWSLNASAARIWNLCEQGCGLNELASAFAIASGRRFDDVLNEMREFCGALVGLGLLKLNGTPAVLAGNVAFQSGLSMPPMFSTRGAGNGSRRRPSPRGISGPG